MKKFLLKRKIAVISIVSLVVVAIIAGVSMIVVQSNKSTPVEETSKTVVGQAITNLIPKDKLGTYLTAPATKEWWATIDGFTPTYQLDTIDFDTLPSEPTMLGWSTSLGNVTNSATQLGLNTVYVAFATEEEATAATDVFIEKGVDNFQAFSAKNVVVIIPTWAFSDVDYVVDEFTSLEAAKEDTIDVGSWTINFSEMQKIVMQAEDKTKVNVYENALKNIGIKLTETAVASSWTGESVDGLVWTGNLSDDGLWKVGDVSYDDLTTTLTETEQLTLMDGTPITREELNKMVADKPNSEIQYITDPQASTVLEYITLQNAEEAKGTISAYDGTYSTPKPIESTNYSLVTINPNAWVGYLTNGTSVRPLVKYDNVELKIFNTGTKLDITLKKAVWADEL